MTHKSSFTYLSERTGGKRKKNSNRHDHITMLTTHYSPLCYKKELANGQATFRRPGKKKTKLFQPSKHKQIQTPKQVTLSILYPGTSGWRGSGKRGGKERKSIIGQVCFSAPRQISFLDSSRYWGGPTYFYNLIYSHNHREHTIYINSSIIL